MAVARPELGTVKDIPIIFPLSLLVILAFTFFTGAYAISENALEDQTPVYASSVAPTPSADDSDPATAALKRQWFENAAIWVCPLH